MGLRSHGTDGPALQTRQKILAIGDDCCVLANRVELVGARTPTSPTLVGAR